MIKATVNKHHELDLDINPVEGTGKLNDEDFSYDLIEKPGKVFHIIKGHKSFVAEIIHENKAEKKVTVLVNGNKYEVEVKTEIDLLLESMGMSSLANQQMKELKAPMPGLVLNVVVNEGQGVKEGDPLVVLEAMKMENVLKSPADGKVKSVEVTQGIAVEKNQILIHFES